MNSNHKDPVIPNRFFFVWAGRTFPYFCRLAVESALLADPEATVEIHLFGEKPSAEPHFRTVTAYDRVSVKEVDFDELFSGLDEPVSRYRAHLDAVPPSPYRASAKSNLFRYALLHRHGGIYLDFDVIVLRDFRDLLFVEAFIGEEYVWKVDEDRVAGRLSPSMIPPTLAYLWAYAVRRIDAKLFHGRRLLEPAAAVVDGAWRTVNLNPAVFGARPGSSFVRRVLSASLESDPRIRYNLGPTLVSRVARTDGSGLRVLSPQYFHMHPPSYSFRYFEEEIFDVEPDNHLIHYVSSNNTRGLQALDPETIVARRKEGLFYHSGASIAERAATLPLKEEGQ